MLSDGAIAGERNTDDSQSLKAIRVADRRPVATRESVRLVTMEVARAFRIGLTHRVRRRFSALLTAVLG